MAATSAPASGIQLVRAEPRHRGFPLDMASTTHGLCRPPGRPKESFCKNLEMAR